MRFFAALVMSCALTACGAEANSNSSGDSKSATGNGKVAVFECRTEYNDVPKGFIFKEKSPAERSVAISELESSFKRDFDPTDKYKATYRYLGSGPNGLSETAMYINDGPAYAHYMTMKGGKLVSVTCLSKDLVSGADFSSSNIPDLVAKELGAEFGSLIRGAS